mmetsp:Transcript_33918/g.97517  ORF Transcript_33918/g.97517 Transcript_33918/m.97517 type:complete len:225 (+) Transcript_33918:103-777(+)
MGNCNTCGGCCTCDFQPAEPTAPQDAVLQKVQLAVSPVAIRVLGLQAYHSSVAVNDVEFSFTKQGLIGAPLFHSHFSTKGPIQVINMGLTDIPASKMLAVLEPYFMAGSYDILRKNCNAFSDCCLYYLLGARLEEQYNAIDKFGTSADKFGLVRLLTMFDYRPNPRAGDFALDQVLEHVGSQRQFDRSCIQSVEASKPPSASDYPVVRRLALGSAHSSHSSIVA